MKQRCILLGLAVLALIGLQSVTAAEPRKITTVEGITEYQLENGLKLLLFPDLSRPTVTVNMTVLVGSRHEGYGEGGMAHLLEHMVFKGTPTHPNVPKALRDRGASFNGTTNSDRTNYFETLPASDDNLEFAIRFEADRLVNSFVRREDLISEMTVVRNEFEQSENSPQNLLGNRMMAAMFDWHNYGKTTIGNRTDIERVPIENLQDFYRRYYQPDNVVLIVAGKFDDAKALAYVQQYFGAIPRPQRKLNTTYTEEPPQDGERRVELRRVGDVGIVAAAWHTPAASHEDAAPLQMLGSILSAQPSGRLYKALVETKLAASAYAGADLRHDPCTFDCQAEVRKEQSLDTVRDIMLKTVDEVIAGGVTEEELERAKRNFLNARRSAALDTSRLAVSLSTTLAHGDWRLYFLHRDRVEKTTTADVQRVAAKYLITANRTLGYFIPADKPALVSVPARPDVKALVAEYKGRPPIAAVPEFDYSFANVEARTTRLKLPSGIKAALLPKPTRDERVELSLALRYGNAENLKEFREAASFLPALMSRGTKNLTYQQLRDEMTKLDVRISSFGSSPGRVEFSVNARKSTLPAALDLLRQILREPALDAKEFETMKPSRIASLEEGRTNPARLARTLYSRLTSPYPPGDVRETVTVDEEIAQTKAVTIDQVRQLYREYLGAVAGELTIIGDFEVQPTLAKINEMLNGWQAAKPYARIDRQAFLNVPGGKHSVLTPDKANANYVAGLQIAMDDQDADYPALVLGNFIFGGGSLSSRLGDRVRQKEGLSYGVSSSFFAGSEDKVGTLMMGAICNPDNITKVETAIREEFERLLKDGIPADEFEKARQAVLLSRQRQRNDDSYIASRLERSLRMDQTLAYDAQIDAKYAALTPDDVHAALKRHFDPKRVVIVVAGDFAGKASATDAKD
jgi:zinc protease